MSSEEKNITKTVKIVDFKSNNKVSLDDNVVKEIIEKGGIEDIPTLIVSIGGVARSGKSFLLNLLVSYLLYLEKNGSDEGWEKSNSEIQGINWARSETAVTLGIWMWAKPCIITRDDGSKVAVLLVDTQGTADNQRSDDTLDTQIMLIGLQLSSFQLINIDKTLRSTELASLELCTDYAEIDQPEDKSGTGKERHHLFESLVFVLRNADNYEDHGEKKGLFKKLKDKCENERLSQSMRGIGKAFKDITAFTFPYPGSEIAKASEAETVWTIQDIPKDFLVATKKLCEALVMSSRQPIDRLSTGREHMAMIETLKMRLGSTEFPDISTHADALQDAVVSRAYTKAQLQYKDNLAKIKKELSMQQTEREVKFSVESIQHIALQVLYTDGHQEKYHRSPIWRKYEERFKSGFQDDSFDLIERYTERKNTEQQKEERKKAEIEAERERKGREEAEKETERQKDEVAKQKDEAGRQETEARKHKLEAQKHKQKADNLQVEIAKLEDKEEKHQKIIDELLLQTTNVNKEAMEFNQKEIQKYRDLLKDDKEKREQREKELAEELGKKHEDHLVNELEKQDEKHKEILAEALQKQSVKTKISRWEHFKQTFTAKANKFT